MQNDAPDANPPHLEPIISSMLMALMSKRRIELGGELPPMSYCTYKIMRARWLARVGGDPEPENTDPTDESEDIPSEYAIKRYAEMVEDNLRQDGEHFGASGGSASAYYARNWKT